MEMVGFVKKWLRLVAVLVMAAAVFSVCSLKGGICSAASDSLGVTVGFYGGPYYKLKEFSLSQMKNMSDSKIYTYSGIDNGRFMTICYARGVRLDNMIREANVDRASVKFLHMATADSYAEVNENYVTWSLDSLAQTRFFYPNMVRFVDINGADLQQQIDFNKIQPEHEAGKQPVPTILAVDSTDFRESGRAEAVRVGKVRHQTGEYGYDPWKQLEEKKADENRYRLLFGQTGLGSLYQAQNVGNSPKVVRKMNIQLDGAPEIKLKKKLIQGKKNKIGSKYIVEMDVSLPEEYSYIKSSIREKLKKQIMDAGVKGDKDELNINYDRKVVKLKRKNSGKYEMEIVGKGSTELSFAYSRQEYGGGTTSASSSVSVTGDAAGSGGGENKKDGGGDKNGAGGDDGNKNGGGKNGAASGKNGGGIKKTDSTDKKKKDSGSSGDKWVSADMNDYSAETVSQNSSDSGNTKGLLGGIAILLFTGASGTVVRFILNIH